MGDYNMDALSKIYNNSKSTQDFNKYIFHQLPLIHHK